MAFTTQTEVDRQRLGKGQRVSAMPRGWDPSVTKSKGNADAV